MPPPSETEFVYTKEGRMTRDLYETKVKAGIDPGLITEEELLEEATREFEIEQYDAPVTTAIEGITGGISLGLIPKSAAAKKRAEVSPMAALGGEVTGMILPALATGGGSLVATGGRAAGQVAAKSLLRKGVGEAAAIARGALASTPAGLLAKGGARIAGPGGIARHAAAGAFESTVAGSAKAISEQIIQDRPISADVLAANILKNAGLGGAVGGAFGAIGKAARAYKARSGLEKALVEGGELSDDAARALAKKSGDDLLDDIIRAGDDAAPETVLGSKRISWRKLFGKVSDDDVVGSAGDMIRAADNASYLQTVARKNQKDLFSPARIEVALTEGRVASKEALDTLQVQVFGAVEDHQKAVSAVQKWRKNFVKNAGGETKLAEGNLPPLGAEDADQAVKILSRLDATQTKLDDLLTDARKVLAPDQIPTVPVAPEKTGLAGLIERSKERFRESSIGQAAITTAGYAEVISDVTGAPAPTQLLKDIPVIGELTSLYLKYKAVRGSLNKLGGVPSSKVAGKASQVSGAWDRIGSITRGMKDATKRVVASQSTRSALAMTAPKAAEIVNQLSSPREITQMVDEETSVLPPMIRDQARQRAQVALDYIKKKAPVNPFVGTPFAKKGNIPTPSELREFGIVKGTIEDPVETLDDIMSDSHPNPWVARDALLNVYPDLWQLTREEVRMAAMGGVLDTLPLYKLDNLGSFFDLPLTMGLALPSMTALGAPPPPAPEPPKLVTEKSSQVRLASPPKDITVELFEPDVKNRLRRE